MMKRKMTVQVTAFLVFCMLIPALFLWEGKSSRYSEEQPDIVLLGDSILGQERGETSVAMLLEDITGKKVFNGALGGPCMARVNREKQCDEPGDVFSMDALSEAVSLGYFGPSKAVYPTQIGTEYFGDIIRELEQIDFREVDIVFINYGMNDYHAATPIYNEYNPQDEFTYAGALQHSIESLRKEYPNLRIILMTPTYSWYVEPDGMRLTPGSEKDLGNGTLEDYVRMETLVAEQMDVELLDVFHDFYAHEEPADCLKYTFDGLHPNETGRRMLAEAMAEYLGM